MIFDAPSATTTRGLSMLASCDLAMPSKDWTAAPRSRVRAFGEGSTALPCTHTKKFHCYVLEASG